MSRVAAELDEVAEALLGAQQDRSASQVLPRPCGLREFRTRCRKRRLHPAKFVLVEAFDEPSRCQQRQRILRVTRCTWVVRQVAFEQRQRLSGAARTQQADREIDDLVRRLARVA